MSDPGAVSPPREERHPEESLREIAERYRALLRASPDGIAITDRTGCVRVASPIALSMLGLQEETEIVGRPITDFIVVHDRERARARIASMFEGMPSRPGRYLGLRVDGGTFDLEANAQLVCVPGGQAVELVIVVRDITARRKVEATLHSIEERNSSILQTAMDGFWFADMEGRVLEVNQTYCRMSGYTESELLGMRVADLSNRTDVPARIAQIRERGEDRFESQHRRKDGSTFEVEISVQYRPIDGGRLIVFLRDITERRRTEELMAASLREKERLLQEVHHRVKNNLQVITSLLRLETSRCVEASTQQVLKDMQGRILSMALLHETLYRTGRFGKVELAHYLQQLAQQFFRAQALASGPVRLTLELAPVEVDIDQAIPCGLIVNELLTNSLKHGFGQGRGGEVKLRLSNEEQGTVRIQVTDDGSGLPADIETKRTQSLGLQLVSDLAKQLMGGLTIGPGSTFTVDFWRKLDSGWINRPK